MDRRGTPAATGATRSDGNKDSGFAHGKNGRQSDGSARVGDRLRHEPAFRRQGAKRAPIVARRWAERSAPTRAWRWGPRTVRRSIVTPEQVHRASLEPFPAAGSSKEEPSPHTHAAGRKQQRGPESVDDCLRRRAVPSGGVAGADASALRALLTQALGYRRLGRSACAAVPGRRELVVGEA